MRLAPELPVGPPDVASTGDASAKMNPESCDLDRATVVGCRSTVRGRRPPRDMQALPRQGRPRSDPRVRGHRALPTHRARVLPEVPAPDLFDVQSMERPSEPRDYQMCTR